MKIKSKQSRVYDYERIDAVVCDLCKQRYEGEDWGVFAPYEVQEIEVRMTRGHVFSEGRFTRTISVDICPDCFENKLMPWLASQGASVHEVDDD